MDLRLSLDVRERIEIVGEGYCTSKSKNIICRFDNEFVVNQKTQKPVRSKGASTHAQYFSTL